MASVPPLRPLCRLVLLPLSLVLVAACASGDRSAVATGATTATAEPAATPAPAQAAAEDAAEPAAAATEAPVERDWLTTADGKRYYLEAYPKKYAHRREDATHVRTVWGPTIEVDREDEANFYYRVYEIDPEAKGPSPPSLEPSEEARASYVLEASTVDRIDLVPFDQGLPRAGQWRNGFAVADLDGDGQLDIAHGAPRKGGRGPMVFLGDGKGSWRRWQAQFPSFPYDYGDAAAGDLDGDGRVDLVFGVHLKGIVALVQQQPGRFALWSQGLPFRADDQSPGFSSRAVDLVDWNGDGKLDVLALGEGPILQVSRDQAQTAAPAMGLRVFLNHGDGSWGEQVLVDPSTGLFGDHLSLADVDADGRLDALLGINVMGTSGVIFRGSDEGDSRLALEPFRFKTYARSTASGDFDGDGDVDVALGFMSHELNEWLTGVDVYLRRADGGYERRLVFVENGNQGIWALDAGDVDGDGRLDVAGATGDGRLVVLLGKGDGGFALNPGVGPEGGPARGCRGYHVELVDLDGDDRAEVIAEFAGERAGLPGVMEAGGCADGGSLRAWRPVAKAR